ncbi:MAG: MBL fold metallo-hydrolase [Alphaproteobacteria bacterium]|nr:MBL fold metallo-hydrolase [Alphaproteobacteria bacterium]
MIRKSFAAALLAGAFSMPALAAEPALKVVSLDMEGGGGTLFVTPEGTSLLIDTGWPSNFGLLPSPDGAKNSADRIVAAAKKLGVKKIDYVIITHYHMDHAGGVVDLAKRIPIGTFIDHGPNQEHAAPGQKPEFGSPDLLYPEYLKVIKGHRHIVAKPGEVIPMGSMTDTIVASAGKVLAKPLAGAGAPNAACNTAEAKSTKPEGGIENSESVASLISYGKVRIAMFGDLSWKNEYELSCPAGKLGHVQVLIATQHGSYISSNPASIADMRPDVAVMGSGGKKGGDEGPIKTIKASPGLMGFWQTHESFAHPEWTPDKNYVADLNPPKDKVAAMAKQLYTTPPDMGYNISLSITKDGSVTVTNSRNGFSKTYQVVR